MLSRPATAASALAPSLTRCPYRYASTFADFGGMDPNEYSTPGARPRQMRPPIITGRKWKKVRDPDTRPGKLDPFSIPNPFKGRGLPYGTRVVFENKQEEELARGEYWSAFIDRFSQEVDYDLVERGWGNYDLYRFPAFKRPFDDITQHNDLDYQFKIANLDMHVHMTRYIPHLNPLEPEIKQDWDNVTKKWQDIVSEVLDSTETEDSTSEVTETTEIVTNVDGSTSEVTRRVGKEITRREEVKKEISHSTIRQFVDDSVEEREFVRLIFIDALGTKHYVYGMVGETLLQCARRYCVPIDGYCNGYDRGFVRIYGYGAWCAQCQMDISPRYFHLMPAFDWQERAASIRYRTITPTSRLGCVIWIRPEYDGMVVSIPVSLEMPYGRKFG